MEKNMPEYLSSDPVACLSKGNHTTLYRMPIVIAV
jgi:hypothetical protein